ncbi:MAG: hypothetical protein ABI611_05445 [Solirubrobacteraceae bacterium]
MAYLRREHADLDRMEFRPGRIPAFNPGGIVAWVVATAIGVTLKMTDTATSQFFDATGPAFHAAAREEALEYGRRGRRRRRSPDGLGAQVQKCSGTQNRALVDDQWRGARRGRTLLAPSEGERCVELPSGR